MAITTHPPSLILALILRGLGVIAKGSTGDQWSGFVSFLPDKDPDDAVAIYDTVGSIDGRSQIDGDYWEHPGIMIHVRSLIYSVGYKKAGDIIKKVDAIKQVTLNLESVTYVVSSIKRMGGINSLGVEPNREPERNLFSINFQMTVK